MRAYMVPVAALIAAAVLTAPAAASSVKFQASGGPTPLHRLGYFRLGQRSNLEVDWTKSSDDCGISIDIFKTHDPNAYYRASIIAGAGSYPGPVELIARLPGRYKVKVQSDCASWSFVIAKTG